MGIFDIFSQKPAEEPSEPQEEKAGAREAAPSLQSLHKKIRTSGDRIRLTLFEAARHCGARVESQGSDERVDLKFRVDSKGLDHMLKAFESFGYRRGKLVSSLDSASDEVGVANWQHAGHNEFIIDALADIADMKHSPQFDLKKLEQVYNRE